METFEKQMVLQVNGYELWQEIHKGENFYWVKEVSSFIVERIETSGSGKKGIAKIIAYYDRSIKISKRSLKESFVENNQKIIDIINNNIKEKMKFKNGIAKFLKKI